MASSKPTSFDAELDNSICSRLELLEEQFFSSIDSDENALEAFKAAFMAFNSFIQQHSFKLSSQTISMADDFSKTVSIVSSGLLEWRSAVEEATDRIRIDVQEALQTCSSVLGRTTSDSSSRSPHVKPCAEWLLRNLHNPYADSVVCADIAQKNGARKQDVTTWFTDARKRIGWNALRKSRFNNKKADIIAAATKFYAESCSEDDLPFCLEQEFAAIESRARELLARFPDSRVVDPRGSYPTPTPSPPRQQAQLLTPVPSFSSCASPAESQSRKRSLSPDVPSDTDDTHRHKRPRSDARDSTQSPSPPPSPVIEASTSRVSPPKRKRRLSDVGPAPSAKRVPPGALPRPQATSNPLPAQVSAEPSSDAWLQDILGDVAFLAGELPSPADIGAAPDTENFEISFSSFATHDQILPQLPDLQSFESLHPVDPFDNGAHSPHDPMADWLNPAGTLDSSNQLHATLWQGGLELSQPTHDSSTTQSSSSSFISQQPPQDFLYMQPQPALLDTNICASFNYPSYQVTAPQPPMGFLASAYHNIPSKPQVTSSEPSKEELLEEMRALRQKVLDLEGKLRAAP